MIKILATIIGVLVVVFGAFFLYSQSSMQANVPTASTTPLATLASSTAPAAPAIVSTATTTSNQNIMSATLETSMGDIAIEFYPAEAPKTVANFIKLAESGYYDGTKFHRVIKGFMDQGGDPLTKDDSQMAAWGTGGPGYTIPDEISPNLTNVAGTMAMANTGAPNTGGSQFFINAVDNPSLNGGYTIFGKVTAGMDVVTAINNVPTDSSDRPLTPVVLKSITLN
ncbi:MAG TPA: peptidylprolyl isomerase [Candidatus Paceibacterota bacterium]|nr:peptidylprolyl isomerase [Candidatus Paceibacterota bacterium]